MQISTEEYINSGKRETDDVLGNAKFNANQKYGNYGITPLMKLTVQAQVTRVYFAVEFRTPPLPSSVCKRVTGSRAWYFLIFTVGLNLFHWETRYRLPHYDEWRPATFLLPAPSPSSAATARPRAGRLSNLFSKSISPYSFLPARRRNEQFENR